MSSTRWISRFRRHLLRSGLPSSYILRVCSEFIDHLNDLGQEHADQEHRLGDPGLVANALVTEYRKRTFVGRHPLLCMLVGLPSLGLSITPLYYFATLVIPVNLMVAYFDETWLNEFAMSTFVWCLLRLIRLGGALVPFAVMALLGTRWIKLIGRGFSTFALMTLVTALFTISCGTRLACPGDYPGPPDIDVRVELGVDHFLQQHACWAVLQVVSPAALVLMFALREFASRRVLLQMKLNRSLYQ